MLKGLDAELFDMSTWTEGHSCGTTACMAGYAASGLHPMLEAGKTTQSDGYKRAGFVRHKTTGRMGSLAFADAYGLTDKVAVAITRPDAEHKTPLKASAAIAALIERLKQEENRPPRKRASKAEPVKLEPRELVQKRARVHVHAG
jgi:hypothetical protein